jgi:hypothetical protein
VPVKTTKKVVVTLSRISSRGAFMKYASRKEDESERPRPDYGEVLVLGGVPGDPGHLLMSLLEPGRGVDADGPAGMAYGVPPRCPTSSSGTSPASRPSFAASAATWRVWLD